MCDRFEVVRVDAATNAAEMIDLLTGGNCFDEHLVAESTGCDVSPREPESSIARASVGDPDPAAHRIVRGRKFHLRTESLHDGESLTELHLIIFPCASRCQSLRTRVIVANARSPPITSASV